jgi:hypothetical protein
VLDYSLMMNIHTCISSKYFISLTITMIVEGFKLMNTSVENCFYKSSLTPHVRTKEEGNSHESIHELAYQAQRHRMTYNQLLNEHTTYLALPAEI